MRKRFAAVGIVLKNKNEFMKTPNYTQDDISSMGREELNDYARELHYALKRSLPQWKMYEEMHNPDGKGLELDETFEGDLYRQCSEILDKVKFVNNV